MTYIGPQLPPVAQYKREPKIENGPDQQAKKATTFDNIKSQLLSLRQTRNLPQNMGVSLLRSALDSDEVGSGKGPNEGAPDPNAGDVGSGKGPNEGAPDPNAGDVGSGQGPNEVAPDPFFGDPGAAPESDFQDVGSGQGPNEGAPDPAYGDPGAAPLSAAIGAYSAPVSPPAKLQLPERTEDTSAINNLPSPTFDYPQGSVSTETRAAVGTSGDVLSINNQIHRDSVQNQSWFVGNDFNFNNQSDQIDANGDQVGVNGGGYGGFQTGIDATARDGTPIKGKGVVFSVWGATESRIGKDFEKTGVVNGLSHDESGEGGFQQIIVPFDFKSGVNYKMDFVAEDDDWVGMYITDPESGTRTHIGSHKFDDHGGLQPNVTTFVETFAGSGKADDVGYFGVGVSSDSQQTPEGEPYGDLEAIARYTELNDTTGFLESGVHQPIR